MDKKLFGQAIAKFAAGLVLVGALLFIPAGTFAYWQTWLLLGILFVVQCFMTGREPVKGYQPKHDAAYYTAHLDVLADELNDALLPQVDKEARAEAGGETVTVFIPHDTYITTRAAVLRYYDASILEFQES